MNKYTIVFNIKNIFNLKSIKTNFPDSRSYQDVEDRQPEK